MSFAIVKADPSLKIREITDIDNDLVKLDDPDEWWDEHSLHILNKEHIQRIVYVLDKNGLKW